MTVVSDFDPKVVTGQVPIYFFSICHYSVMVVSGDQVYLYFFRYINWVRLKGCGISWYQVFRSFGPFFYEINLKRFIPFMGPRKPCVVIHKVRIKYSSLLKIRIHTMFILES